MHEVLYNLIAGKNEDAWTRTFALIVINLFFYFNKKIVSKRNDKIRL